MKIRSIASFAVGTILTVAVASPGSDLPDAKFFAMRIHCSKKQSLVGADEVYGAAAVISANPTAPKVLATAKFGPFLNMYSGDTRTITALIGNVPGSPIAYNEQKIIVLLMERDREDISLMQNAFLGAIQSNVIAVYQDPKTPRGASSANELLNKIFPILRSKKTALKNDGEILICTGTAFGGTDYAQLASGPREKIVYSSPTAKGKYDLTLRMEKP